MTITDIATEAGVSIATVSRFLNNGPVKDATKKKLEEVILRMNYLPESSARRITNSKTSAPSYAVISHSLSNLYSSEFVEGVSNLFSEQNALCYTLCCTNIEEEYRGLLDVVSRGFAGAILHDLAEGVALIELYNRLCRKLPLVIVHSFPADLDCNSITVNQEKGMKDAMAYLLGLGHRKIAYVAGEAGYSFKLKEKIWQEELEKIGLPPQKQDSIKAANTDFISGIDTSRREVLKYFENGNRPTAIFTANDIMALGTLAALNELGLRVPDDISLMSHDNTMFAKTYNLTCIDMKIKSVGIAAVDLLEYAVHGSDSTPRHITISPELVIRTSCKAI